MANHIFDTVHFAVLIREAVNKKKIADIMQSSAPWS